MTATLVVGPRLGLDRDDDPARRDRHGIDVTSPLPGQRMPQPPPLRLKRRKLAPDLVLRASAHATALRRATASGERRGRVGVRAQPRRRPRGPPSRPRRPAPAATVAPLAIAAMAARYPPPVLLAARVVQAAPRAHRGSSRRSTMRRCSHHPRTLPPRRERLAGVDLINAASRSAALNPTEMSANHPDCESRDSDG